MGCDAAGASVVGGKAVLPEMKRRDGFGPRSVDVTCVTMGSALCECEYIHVLFSTGLTNEDLVEEVFLCHQGILLEVSLVVVEWTVIPAL